MTEQRTEHQDRIKFSWKREWPLLVLLLGACIYGLYVYPSLPAKVPSHWNIYGQVDRYGSRFWGAFGIPLLNLGTYLLLLVTPWIDPRKERYVAFARTYHIFRYAFHLLLTGLYVVILLGAAGKATAVDRMVPIGISILFIIIGNYFGKIRQNYFFGIRTPWTLADPEVWQKTHRIAGPVWVTGGLIALGGSMVGGVTSFMIFFSMLAVMIIVPVVYSYFAFKKLNG